MNLRRAKGPKPPNARQLMNEWNLKVYAGVIVGLIFFFIMLHWAKFLMMKYRSSRTWRVIPGHSLMKTIYRQITRLAVRPIRGFPSLGHALIVVIYFGVNLLFCFLNVDRGKASNFGARFGWMTTANIVLSVFFGLKNTPLAILTHHSYDRLNFLHQIVGYTAVAQMILHAICYMVWESSKHAWYKLVEPNNWEGIAAGIAMLILCLGIFRHIGYELFYISHILGCALTLVFTALHRPYWIEKIPVAMLVAACIWASDRLFRGSRLIYNLPGNQASLYPLSNGGVRLVFKKRLPWAIPGSHCFVWIPEIRLFQSHPFTIVSNSDSGLELVLKSYSGFTKSVHNYATASPGSSVRASFDGPYGSFPDPAHFDKIVLIAGGSGATFTFGLAVSLLDRLGLDARQQIDFIWAVKEKENIVWFAEHLDKLKGHQSSVSLTLHVTQQAEATSSNENLASIPDLSSSGATDEGEKSGHDCPKQDTDTTIAGYLSDLKYEKLQVESLIGSAIETVGIEGSVLVAVCGPQSLSDVVTAAAARCMVKEGPSIEIHSEYFGW